jgi:hypothetical protein
MIQKQFDWALWRTSGDTETRLILEFKPSKEGPPIKLLRLKTASLRFIGGSPDLRQKLGLEGMWRSRLAKFPVQDPAALKPTISENDIKNILQKPQELMGFLRDYREAVNDALPLA